MSKLRVAINGFGRIGRVTMRNLIGRDEIEVVAINDLTDNQTLAHLFKYDSIHRMWPGDVSADADSITINGNRMAAFAERDPAKLPWADLKVDVVVESTGFFRTAESAGKHIEAGCKKVVISAPGKGDGIRSVVLGVNDHLVEASDTILSNASCTTNCVAPLVKVLLENFGIESAFLTTVHAYTSDQRIHDAPHSDLRRARAAAENIVPTSTGAATAVTKIFPELKGKIGGSALRVPVPDGSITDLTAVVSRDVSVDEINAAFKKAAEGPLKGILQYNTDPIVSVDILSNPYSSIFDAELTASIGSTVKVVSWYDNEYGYSARMADLLVKLAGMA
jgi:glyceraldehyde 3-phosphate dehydrogenase